MNLEELDPGLDPEEDKARNSKEDPEAMEEMTEEEGQLLEAEENQVLPEMCSPVTLNRVTQSSSQRLRTKQFWILDAPKPLVANTGSGCTSKVSIKLRSSRTSFQKRFLRGRNSNLDRARFMSPIKLSSFP